jgi:hypothetical protein
MRVIQGGGCAACYTFNDKPHVDMSAAFDGPVLENGMTIDDLILCEDCVRSAAQALSLDNERDIVTAAEVKAEAAEARAEKWKRYANSLESVRELKPQELPEVKKTGRRAA